MAQEHPTPRGVRPKVLVVGGGIGGCSAALALHKAGADVSIFEQASIFREVGAGINIQGVAVSVLADLGVTVEALGDPDRGDGIETSRVQYLTPEGIFITEEPTGIAAGATHPQFSMHRAKLHATLVEACRQAIGSEQMHLDRSFERLEVLENGVMAHFRQRSTGEALPPVCCDLLVGADGLRSRVRAALLGDQRPRYTGRTIFRGVCEVDEAVGDGRTVANCGNHNRPGNFICYPISEGCRRAGRTLCNWALCVHRPDPGAGESWTGLATMTDISEDLQAFDGHSFGGQTPLQLVQRSPTVIGWALFDRDPLDTFDFGRVTLLGDAAHPLLPFGSQGATQAILDAEALGIALSRTMAQGEDVASAVRAYSESRCAIAGQIVIANREMGPTRVLEMVEQKCKDMSPQEKAAWIQEHGCKEGQEVIRAYRAAMPRSVRAAPANPAGA